MATDDMVVSFCMLKAPTEDLATSDEDAQT
jgi:hypothetical protein